MANVQLNVFELTPGINVSTATISQNFVHFKHIYFPGSISWNTPYVLISQGNVNARITFSVGLYSINGASLSLANSASGAYSANGFSWVSLATSATQNITPGDWFVAYAKSTSGNAGITVMNQNVLGQVAAGSSIESTGYAGPFFGGRLANSSGAFPGSVATSDLSKDFKDGSRTYIRIPYIVISA